MAVKIRLARTGAKKAPYYRVVVADSRARRDGRFIEIVGRYNPRTQPSTVELDVDKVKAWVAQGAQMTETVEKLLAIAEGTKEAPSAEPRASKKAAAKAAAEANAAEEVVAAPVEAAVEAPAEVVEEPPAEATEETAPEAAEASEEPAAESVDEPAEAAESAADAE